MKFSNISLFFFFAAIIALLSAEFSFVSASADVCVDLEAQAAPAVKPTFKQKCVAACQTCGSTCKAALYNPAVKAAITVGTGQFFNAIAQGKPPLQALGGAVAGGVAAGCLTAVYEKFKPAQFRSRPRKYLRAGKVVRPVRHAKQISGNN